MQIYGIQVPVVSKGFGVVTAAAADVVAAAPVPTTATTMWVPSLRA